MNLNKNTRPKKTKQYTKEELLNAIKICNNDKLQMMKFLDIKEWSVRNQLKLHNINIDKRIGFCHNKSDIPPKEELIDHYTNKNLNMSEIGKIYNVSNVTARKWFKHYDIEILSHSEVIKQKAMPKMANTNIEKYGTEHYFASDIGKQKIAESFTKIYGVPYHPIGSTSKAEVEVLDYFNSLIDGFKKAHIHGIELDGYNEKLKIGFEYCGLFWHKESIKGKDLHERKYKICKENGIRLFTIFEDEWKERNKQVKGFIQSSLNKNDIKLYARNTTLAILDRSDRNVKQFLNDFHIQGAIGSTTTLKHFALFSEGEIVSVMSVGRHHRNVNELVISRCCTKVGFNILGGSKRLFSAISKHYAGRLIKTWSDNRWTEGYLYERLGFTLEIETDKDYSYVGVPKEGRRSKQSMKKKNIGATTDQTEYQRAIELGYDRIWDCGKKTWIKQL